MEKILLKNNKVQSKDATKYQEILNDVKINQINVYTVSGVYHMVLCVNHNDVKLRVLCFIC